jgi:hypothetical protein
MGEEGEKPTRVDPETGLTINRYNRADRHQGVANRRVRAVGPHTENLTRLPHYALRVIHDTANYPEGYERPTTRGDCEKGGINEARPCPWVSCRAHLHLDSTEIGNVKINKPDEEVWEMSPDASCSLDVAAHGGVSLEVVGAVFNVSRERARQLEERALRRLFVTLKLQGREGEMRELLAALGEQEHDSPLASAEENE